jgi:HD-GYP domain-containing protein (c-di-GMP phosphodiesterase class II)
MSEEYKEVPLKMVDPVNDLPVNLYLCINDKFLHYLNSGDSITSPKYDLFLNKNVKSVYVKDADYDVMMDWCLTVRHTFKEELVQEAGIEAKEVIEETLDMEVELYDVFSDQPLDLKRIDKLQAYSHEFVEKVKEIEKFKKALSALLKRNETLAAHSSNTANLAIFIGMITGIGSKYALEGLYMAALFHDFGKVKIPSHIIENPSDAHYESLMNGHPEASVKIIAKSEGIPSQVIRMILEHHEHWDGSGYPNGTKGLDLYEYTAVLSMANELDSFLVKNRLKPDVKRWEMAIKMLENGKGSKWNPMFFPRVPEALKIAFLPQALD